ERFGTTNVHQSPEIGSRLANGHNAAVFMTRMVLASKLGMADELEGGRISFLARLRTSATGHVNHSNLKSEASETITMANLLVTISQGADLIPYKTASYSQILWVPVNRFLQAVQRKDPSVLGLDPLEFCIHGLCIATSYDMFAVQLGLGAYE